MSKSESATDDVNNTILILTRQVRQLLDENKILRKLITKYENEKQEVIKIVKKAMDDLNKPIPIECKEKK